MFSRVEHAEMQALFWRMSQWSRWHRVSQSVLTASTLTDKRHSGKGAGTVHMSSLYRKVRKPRLRACA